MKTCPICGEPMDSSNNGELTLCPNCGSIIDEKKFSSTKPVKKKEVCPYCKSALVEKSERYSREPPDDYKKIYRYCFTFVFVMGAGFIQLVSIGGANSTFLTKYIFFILLYISVLSWTLYTGIKYKKLYDRILEECKMANKAYHCLDCGKYFLKK